MIITLKRWKNNWKDILRDFLSCMGLCWLLLEIITYFFIDFASTFQTFNVLLVILCISLIYGVFKNYPKSSYIKKIRDKDVYIEIRIGDAFKNRGSLIIPINNEFNLSLNGNVKKAKSLQNRLIVDFYDSKEEHLKSDIANKLNLSKIPYAIGTTVEVEQKNKTFYLVVNSNNKDNNRVESNIDDFMMALNGIWDYLANNASKDELVTIPLLNTQHGRDSNLNRLDAVKQIIETFIDATKYKIICDYLIISIFPSDLKKGDINFDYLIHYLDFQCDNYKDIKFNLKPIGQEIESTNIESLRN